MALQKLYLTKIEWTCWAISSDPDEAKYDKVIEIPGNLVDLFESTDDAFHDLQNTLELIVQQQS